MHDEATLRVKVGLAEMLEGVSMDVVTAEQASVAENIGAVAALALERVPADIRRDGGVAGMSDPAMIEEIQSAVAIHGMAKSRIGHFARVGSLAESAQRPVPLFCAGGIATPADATVVMQLGAQAVFRRSGIFSPRHAAAIVETTTNFKDPERLALSQQGLRAAMNSLEAQPPEPGQELARRGW